VTVVFRGREVTHNQLGVALLKRVADDLLDAARLDAPPGMEGRSMSIVLTPGARKADKTIGETDSAKTEDS
jgi:translation initiation factor IF-3